MIPINHEITPRHHGFHRLPDELRRPIAARGAAHNAPASRGVHRQGKDDEEPSSRGIWAAVQCHRDEHVHPDHQAGRDSLRDNGLHEDLFDVPGRSSITRRPARSPGRRNRLHLHRRSGFGFWHLKRLFGKLMMWNLCHPGGDLSARKTELLAQGKYLDYLLTFGGHECLFGLLGIEARLPDKDYWKCLAETWSNIECSAPHLQTWIRLFESERKCRAALMTKKERAFLRALPQELTLYRGYAKGRVRRGMSWTLSKECANFFARYATGPRRAFLCGHQQGGIGMRVTGRCDRRDVLALFNEREEQEIVIRPDRVFALRSQASHTNAA